MQLIQIMATDATSLQINLDYMLYFYALLFFLA